MTFSTCQGSGHDPINLIYDPMLKHNKMAKLQKQISYKHKDRPIYKYRINISAKYVEELGWREGVELELKVKNNKLEITKSKIQK